MTSYRKLFLPVSLLFIFLSHSLASAAPLTSTRPITVNINGSFIAADSSTFIESGRIKIPVRTLASLGLTYTWDAKTHTAVITDRANNTFTLIQGQLTAYKNGQPVQMDSEAGNYNGRIMVPARFVSEAFGYGIYYERTRGILFITSKEYVPDPAKIASTKLHEARLAAISLPIHYSFTPDREAESDRNPNYTYTFAANDATRYTYGNGIVTTVVEIKEGVAEAVWQYNTNGIPGYDLYTTLGGQEPEYMQEMFNNYFSYFGGAYKALYKLADGSVQSFPYQAGNYGDIIQPIPE